MNSAYNSKDTPMKGSRLAMLDAAKDEGAGEWLSATGAGAAEEGLAATSFTAASARTSPHVEKCALPTSLLLISICARMCRLRGERRGHRGSELSNRDRSAHHLLLRALQQFDLLLDQLNENGRICCIPELHLVLSLRPLPASAKARTPR